MALKNFFKNLQEVGGDIKKNINSPYLSSDVQGESPMKTTVIDRDGGLVSVSVNIGIFCSIGIGWIEKYSIGIGKYLYFCQVSVLVSVNIGIFWSNGISIGWIKKYSIGKNNSDPPSLVCCGSSL